MRNWMVYTVEVNDKWCYIIDEPGSLLWDGYVSKPIYIDQQDAEAAGARFVSNLRANQLFTGQT